MDLQKQEFDQPTGMCSKISILWQRCSLKQIMFPSMKKFQNQIGLIPRFQKKGATASGSQDSLESLPADAATLAPKLQVSLGEVSSIPN
ncbi:hypothetical protein ANN_15541 [Periplaneta americana]|uniref:Uncharacterized protein n=1 Tax=Periplaneta americana TaxID=6978 RepID=A0ABQ8SI00_PERAM|nr:hypothetical protein ANN_15541 [Periplaneta americana]